MAQHLRIANAGIVNRQIGDWADTKTALDIQRSLDLVRASEKPAITMVAGAPGVGKTTAVQQFCKSLGHNAIYIQAARGEGTAWNFAHAFANLWPYHIRPSFNCQSEAREKLADFMGPDTTLVIDEAQYLNQRNPKTRLTGEAFEWLRATAEKGGFDLIFCGDLDLPLAIEAMPQLQSRLMRPVVIRQVCRADIVAIVEGTTFADARSIDALHAIAKMRGGLRNVENVTRIAQLFAGHGTPSHEHLKAAIVDMKLSPKGGI